MFWGCITLHSTGPLVTLDLPMVTDKNGRRKRAGFNQQRYVAQILSGPLKDFWVEREEALGQDVLIVEDGASAHRFGFTNKAHATLGIQQLPHPASSPDLNPIEPLWNVVKERIWGIPGAHSSISKLTAAVHQVWGELTAEDVEKHTLSMQARVDAVKAANGWHTRF